MPRQGDPAGPGRHTFLLSVWRERAGGPWRAALRPADGGARLGFADLRQLVAYLLRLDDERSPAAARDAAPPGDTSQDADRDASPPRAGGGHPR